MSRGVVLTDNQIPRLGEFVIQVDLSPLFIEYIEIENTEREGTVTIMTGIVSINHEKFEWDAFKDRGDHTWTILGDSYSSRFRNAVDQSIIESEIRKFLDDG